MSFVNFLFVRSLIIPGAKKLCDHLPELSQARQDAHTLNYSISTFYD